MRVVTTGECLLSTNRTVSGTRLLAQKFLIELLTVEGSMRYLPERGCGFLKRIRGAAMTEFDVLVAFAAAKNQIRRHLRNDEREVRDPAERYRDCSLNHIILDAGSLQLDLTVFSRAGTAIRIVTPPIQL